MQRNHPRKLKGFLLLLLLANQNVRKKKRSVSSSKSYEEGTEERNTFFLMDVSFRAAVLSRFAEGRHIDDITPDSDRVRY